MQNKRSYITGFLLIVSIHWSVSILTAILTNILGLLVEYEYIPWFGVFMRIIELFFAYYVLDKDRFFELNNKSLLKLALFAVTLLLLSQFNYLLDYQSGWCGNALLDDSLQGVFETRKKNEFYSQMVEKIILSIGIIYYVLNIRAKR